MLSGISPLSLLLIFLIILVLFGAKRLRNIGSDLGQAVKSFRKGVQDDDKPTQDESKKDDSVEQPKQ